MIGVVELVEDALAFGVAHLRFIGAHGFMGGFSDFSILVTEHVSHCRLGFLEVLCRTVADFVAVRIQ